MMLTHTTASVLTTSPPVRSSVANSIATGMPSAVAAMPAVTSGPVRAITTSPYPIATTMSASANPRKRRESDEPTPPPLISPSRTPSTM